MTTSNQPRTSPSAEFVMGQVKLVPSQDPQVRASETLSVGKNMKCAHPRRPLILVADDDEDFCDYICAILENGEYDLLSVNDGAAAMDYIDTALLDPLSSHLPDLLITDLQMPRCDGMKVLAYTKFLPTIAMTAFGDSATHAEARRCGANFVFDKPIDVGKLQAVVGALVH